MSKGSRSRVSDLEAYRRNYERIFKKGGSMKKKRSGNESQKIPIKRDGPPNPGSPEAVAAGCTCPVVDNHNGTGSDWGPGTYWMTEGCPVHAPAGVVKALVDAVTGKADLSKSQSRRLTVQRGFHKLRRD